MPARTSLPTMPWETLTCLIPSPGSSSEARSGQPISRKRSLLTIDVPGRREGADTPRVGIRTVEILEPLEGRTPGRRSPPSAWWPRSSGRRADPRSHTCSRHPTPRFGLSPAISWGPVRLSPHSELVARVGSPKVAVSHGQAKWVEHRGRVRQLRSLCGASLLRLVRSSSTLSQAESSLVVCSV